MPTSNKAVGPRKIAIVGAGNISQVHVEAIRHCGAGSIVAVLDADLARAQAQAALWGAPQAFADTSALIAAGIADTAHVLVPPPLHRAVAEPLLAAGIDVLLEKPMAASAAECDALLAAAKSGNARLGINQNFLFLPAYLALKRDIETGALGRLRHVMCYFNMPVRQIGARQFGHWMFRLPQNILLEQAVHPLAHVLDLVGPIGALEALPGEKREIAPGTDFYATWQVMLKGTRADAQVLLSVGENLPAWGLIALCDDGMAQLDILADRRIVQRKTKWPAFFDEFLNESAAAGTFAGKSTAKLSAYLLSLLKLKPRSDQFFRTMTGSIAAFYAGLAAGGPPVDGPFGADVVRLCERIAGPLARDPSLLSGSSTGTAPSSSPLPGAPGAEIALLGGTGFIGTHVVRRLIAEGRKVRVMARNTHLLPAPFHDPLVEVVRGNIGNGEDVERAIADCPFVINLAHGGGGGSWPEVERSMVGGALAVAEACLKQKSRRFVQVGSIAGLYLGDGAETITAATPPDPHPERRADYGRAKAVSDQALLALATSRDLPLVILRPGVVVGEGGIPFHSGVGFFNVDQHCLGWNEGLNPLPFVLVEDVADAIVRALGAEGVTGRTFNLVGDIRLSARDYIAELSRALGRPLVFHPQSVYKLESLEAGKWLVKRAIGRKAAFPDLRDLKSSGMNARFDTRDEKTALAWQPTAGREEFIRRGIDVYAEA